MLLKIREKAQGIFAWVILILICVPFALWGIQNYLDVGKESFVAKVGDKEFFQRDVNRAYAEYSQRFAGMQIDEQILKQQALEKLIRDEVLLQYVENQDLSITDETLRHFIQSLPYFQVDGKFSKTRYEALLNAQNMNSTQFAEKIRKSLAMEQFQRSIVDSSFATQYDIDSFYKIQNEQRKVEYLTVPVTKPTEKPSAEEIIAYYQQHRDEYKTPEKVSVEYIELSVADLAKNVTPTDAQLHSYYNDHKEQYSTKERRKISHILFAVNAETSDKAALEKALQAKQRLAKEEFSAVAKELSDDKLSAKNGGDLGLFTKGTMEPSFETAVLALQQGQVSDPVKTPFGYHLIKVTELLPGETKTFEEVKETIKQDVQKAEAENKYYELADKVTEVSYEHSDNLTDAAQAIGVGIKKSALFTRSHGEGIAAEASIRNAAFSDEVLKGTNSEPIELGNDRVVILRALEHQPAAARELKTVENEVTATLLDEKAKQQATILAEQIKKRLLANETLAAVAAANQLEVKKIDALTRNDESISWQLKRAIFSAPKPSQNKASIFIVALPSGEQTVVSLSAATSGNTAGIDKKQLDLAYVNIAKVLGESAFNAVMNELQAHADIIIHNKDDRR
ncbi:MAG: SurA N-terminal domain-containing protein [Gammaproteobacteria bacterium]